jgi:AhpD family alkylhydroperoxidase
MLADWKEVLKANIEAFGNLGRGNPELTRAVLHMPTAGAKGALDTKTRELISLAVAATTRCDGCISIHAAEAVRAGATRGEVLDTLAVAVAANAGAAIMYSGRILEAFDQNSR